MAKFAAKKHIDKKPKRAGAMQHAWVHEQQLTLSCHYYGLRAHLKLMLCFDILLQSTNIKRETTLPVPHDGRNGERKGEKRMSRGEKKKGDEGRMRRERDGGWRKRVWADLCVVYAS